MMFTSIPRFLKEVIKIELRKIDYAKLDAVKLGIKLFLEGVDNRTDREWVDLIDTISTYVRANEEAASQSLGGEVVKLFKAVLIEKMQGPDLSKRLADFFTTMERMKKSHAAFKANTEIFSAFGLNGDNVDEILDMIWPKSLSDLKRQREEHFQKLDRAFEEVKKILTSVLSNMDAKEHAKEFLDDDIGKLNESLSQFHGLACSGRVIAQR